MPTKYVVAEIVSLLFVLAGAVYMMGTAKKGFYVKSHASALIALILGLIILSAFIGSLGTGF